MAIGVEQLQSIKLGFHDSGARLSIPLPEPDAQAAAVAGVGFSQALIYGTYIRIVPKPSQALQFPPEL